MKCYFRYKLPLTKIQLAKKNLWVRSITVWCTTVNYLSKYQIGVSLKIKVTFSSQNSTDYITREISIHYLLDHDRWFRVKSLYFKNIRKAKFPLPKISWDEMASQRNARLKCNTSKNFTADFSVAWKSSALASTRFIWLRKFCRSWSS